MSDYEKMIDEGEETEIKNKKIYAKNVQHSDYDEEKKNSDDFEDEVL